MKTAYDKTYLKARLLNDAAETLFDEGKISSETLTGIKTKYTDKLYTPNIFIACAMSLATTTAGSFATGLYYLLFNKSFDHDTGIRISFFVFTIGFYVALEFLVKTFRFYNAGIDNVLQISVLVFSYWTIAYESQNSLWGFISITFIAAWLAYRFYDALFACIAFISLLISFILSGEQFGGIIYAAMPFLIMLVSFFIFKLTEKIIKKELFDLYKKIFVHLKTLSLIALYVSGNYFAVNLLNDNDAKVGGIFGLFFWMWTCAVPFIYIAYGIVKKDLLIVRIGVILIAAIVFTVRYYYSVMPPETAMIVAGILLISVSYLLIKYLAVPKRGFTSKQIGSGNAGRANVEALIIAQTFGKTSENTSGNTMPPHTTFEGGTSSGGGASDNF
jgi:uncharacterized membrane protein YgcG